MNSPILISNLKKSLIYLCFLIFTFSCTTNNNQINSDFYALRVDNSWVYHNYKYNELIQDYEFTGVIDSVFIEGTETRNNNLYYRFRTNTTGNENNVVFCNPNGISYELLRDSIGYLVNSNGILKFVHNNYNEHLITENSWGNIYLTLQEGINNIDVEAGLFTTLDSERYVRTPINNSQLYGMDNIHYSDGYGLIFETFSFVNDSTQIIQRRLDSYDVN